MDLRERAVAWRRGEHGRVCDRIEPWAHGTSVRCSRLPEFWIYNTLRVEDPACPLDAAALAGVAEEHQADLGHRQVEIEDEATGARLLPGFDALGWATERLSWMRLAGAAPAGPDFPLEPFANTRPLRIQWSLDAPWTPDEATATRFAASEEAAAELRGSRALIARDAAGAPIAFVVFVSHAGGAEIDSAYVVPERRGHGLGGALVAAAARTAAAADTFIVADEDDDPKRLYRRLGFEPVWLQHVFTRRPR